MRSIKLSHHSSILGYLFKNHRTLKVSTTKYAVQSKLAHFMGGRQVSYRMVLASPGQFDLLKVLATFWTF